MCCWSAGHVFLGNDRVRPGTRGRTARSRCTRRGRSSRKFGPSWKQSTGHTSTQSVYLHLMHDSSDDVGHRRYPSGCFQKVANSPINAGLVQACRSVRFLQICSSRNPDDETVELVLEDDLAAEPAVRTPVEHAVEHAVLPGEPGAVACRATRDPRRRGKLRNLRPHRIRPRSPQRRCRPPPPSRSSPAGTSTVLTSPLGWI